MSMLFKIPCIPSNFIKYSLFFCFGIILFLNENNAQVSGKNFKETTENLISKASQSYSDLELLLKPIQQDTSLMRYFANASAKENYHTGVSYALNKLGIVYRDYSEYNKAIRLHQMALDAAVENYNIEFQIYSLAMLSAVYGRTEAIRSSLDCAQKAIDLAETLEQPNEDIKKNLNFSVNRIGHIYRTLGEFDLAIANFRKSIVLETELGNIRGLAMNYKDIGECLEAMGELEKALENYQKSLALNEKIGSKRIHVISNLGLAHTYVHLEKNKEALDILKSIIGFMGNPG